MRKNMGYSFDWLTKNYTNYLFTYFSIFGLIFAVMCYLAVDADAIFLTAIITASCCAGCVALCINFFSKDHVYWHFLPASIFAAAFAVHALLALIFLPLVF